MKRKLLGTAILIGTIWLVFLANFILPENFVQNGIRPRTAAGLSGVFFAPFLHADAAHLTSNTVPLFLLTLTLLVFYERLAVRVWILTAVCGGLLVWLLARGNASHVGASGVILGLVGFLLASGVFRRSLRALLVSTAIFILYGGVLLGIFPSAPFVSWESHLCGFLTGVMLAYLFRKSPANADDPSGASGYQ
jgi:membrane associated rhomboid family serine protease